MSEVHHVRAVSMLSVPTPVLTGFLQILEFDYSLLMNHRHCCCMDQQLSPLYLAVTKQLGWFISVSVTFWRGRDDQLTHQLTLIGRLPTCPNGPQANTIRFGYNESIARVLGAPQKLEKRGIVVLCADGRTGYTFPQIASFLADFPEQCTITMVKSSCCPQCNISPDDMPSFGHRSWHFHPQQKLHLLTPSAEAVGLGKFANYPNFTDPQAGCNKYSCMNIDQLHQLLKGLLKDHTWKWTDGYLKNICGQERVWTW